MQGVHFQVRVGVFNCQQILAKISFVILDIVIKKQIECGLTWHWWNSTDLGLINWHVFKQSECRNCCLYIIIQKITPQAKSEKYFQIWFFPRFGGEKIVAFWACTCKLSWTLLSPAWVQSAPIGGGKKGEFRDWTRDQLESLSSIGHCAHFTFDDLCLTNRFHVAVRLFSNRSQMTSKCGKNK